MTNAKRFITATAAILLWATTVSGQEQKPACSSIQFSAARKTFGSPSQRGSQPQDRAQEEPRPSVSGTGTTGRITKWVDGPTGALGDSVITELNGNIGINGAPSPIYKLDVNGHNRFRGSNVSFYLTGSKPTGNEWVFQTVDADGRLRVFDNTSGSELEITTRRLTVVKLDGSVSFQ